MGFHQREMLLEREAIKLNPVSFSFANGFWTYGF